MFASFESLQLEGSYVGDLLPLLFRHSVMPDFLQPHRLQPGGSDRKVSACSAGDQGLIPGSGKSPGEGNGSPMQYSFLENSMDRGAW